MSEQNGNKNFNGAFPFMIKLRRRRLVGAPVLFNESGRPGRRHEAADFSGKRRLTG